MNANNKKLVDQNAEVPADQKAVMLADQKAETLKILLNQITSFDNKASIIVTILGIVFALSFTVIDVIAGKSACQKPYIFASFISFLVCVLLSFTFAISVFSPRKRKKNIVHKRSLTYYEDLKDMDAREYEDLFNASNDAGASIEQINTNAEICSKKHKHLIRSIRCLIFVALFSYQLLF